MKGVYRALFSTDLNRGTGVVFLDDNRLLGADGSMFYVGDFDQLEGGVRAEFHVIQYSQGESFFGRSAITVVGAGKMDGSVITGVAETVEFPGVKMQFMLEKIMD